MKKIEAVTKSDPYTEMVTYTGTVAEFAALAFYARYYAEAAKQVDAARTNAAPPVDAAATRLSRKINIELPADFYLNQDKIGL